MRSPEDVEKMHTRTRETENVNVKKSEKAALKTVMQLENRDHVHDSRVITEKSEFVRKNCLSKRKEVQQISR